MIYLQWTRMERQGDTHSSSSKSTTKETHDTTSILKESSRDGILYLRKQCVLHLSTLSKVIWQGYVTRRWAFSRIANPLSLKVNLGTTGLTNPVSNPVSNLSSKLALLFDCLTFSVSYVVVTGKGQIRITLVLYNHNLHFHLLHINVFLLFVCDYKHTL